MVTRHSTRFMPDASVCSSSCSVPATRVRTRTDCCVRVSRLARSAKTARSALASTHSTRSRSIRTGPVPTKRTGRQMPPGFQSGSIQSQCWNTPVRLRLALRLFWAAQATSTANVCSEAAANASVTSKV